MATPVRQFIFSYNEESNKKICELFSNLIAKKIYESPEVQATLKNNSNDSKSTSKKR